MSILALASGKGGTGVTSLSIALGASLVEHGLDTTLVDANISLPTIGLQLGTPNVPFGLHDALSHDGMIKDAVYHHAPSGLKVIPGRLGLQHVTKGKHHQLLNLPRLVGKLSPQILLDCASGISLEALAGLAIADEAVIVTTPELQSVIGALKVIKRCDALKVPVRGVIVNQAGKTTHELAVSNIQALVEKKILATIPYDASVSEALVAHHPFTYSHPDSKAAQAVKALAAQWVS